MNLFFLGFQNAGKTYFGARLAKQILLPHIDLDQKMCEMYQKPVRLLYQTLGEKAFRKLESDALFSLKNISSAIISLGGGTPLLEKNRKFLQSLPKKKLIYLKMSWETALARALKNPSSFVDPQHFQAHLKELYEKRVPIYEQIAEYTLDIDCLSEETILALSAAKVTSGSVHGI